MPVLTPDQFERLQRILTDAFDKRGIAELVRTKLGDRLDNLVDPDQPTRQIVFDLLTWIDKRDMHMLEVLLQGAIRMKPENNALRAFCEHDVPGALKPIDSQVYAKAEIGGPLARAADSRRSGSGCGVSGRLDWVSLDVGEPPRCGHTSCARWGQLLHNGLAVVSFSFVGRSVLVQWHSHCATKWFCLRLIVLIAKNRPSMKWQPLLTTANTLRSAGGYQLPKSSYIRRTQMTR